MADDIAKTETPVEASVPVAAPAQESTTTVKKGGNKALWIILGVIAFLILCCVGIFVILWATGASFVHNLFGTAARLDSLDTVFVPTNNDTDTSTDGTDSNTDDTDTSDYDFGDLFGGEGNFAVAVQDVDTDGSNYVITMDVKNQGTSPTTFSSILYISLVDEDGNSYSQNFFYDIPSEERLDLEIAAGETFTGRIAFLVDDNPSSLTLQVSDSLFDDTPTEFRIK